MCQGMVSYAMEQSVRLFGLEFSVEKTGCTKINSSREIPAVGASSLPKDDNLPEGDVQWEFLKLESDGRFVIDQAKVDIHIVELRRQLDNCKSVPDWI